ncbi:hypothetical protein [Spirosoma sordidisoli]|uniref:Uncharacterized protein n=1 Tax=Spirosoma sordidisoli TaxID=2502893 RepID=A0A4V1RWL8_9BACT|nr:hypothetical protein [Spirosoma sordidisoli]RYC70718.1 hypothetical protein EQG79_00770 [Spirosoma sordidisoli]
MNYLCLYIDGKPKPIQGPLPEREIVDMISMVGPIEVQLPYGNWSRYMLAKDKHYPNTKKGDTALVADIAANADLLATFRKLTRLFWVDCYYPDGSEPIHCETIRAANEQMAIEKMEGIMRFRVDRHDLPTLRYNARTRPGTDLPRRADR